MEEKITAGDSVQWEFGSGIGAGTDSGVVADVSVHAPDSDKCVRCDN